VRDIEICGEFSLEGFDLRAQDEPAPLNHLREPGLHFGVVGSLPSLELE
jgi:hypothetical protein